jgi:hypothetical protein
VSDSNSSLMISFSLQLYIMCIIGALMSLLVQLLVLHVHRHAGTRSRTTAGRRVGGVLSLAVVHRVAPGAGQWETRACRYIAAAACLCSATAASWGAVASMTPTRVEL